MMVVGGLLKEVEGGRMEDGGGRDGGGDYSIVEVEVEK